MQRAARAMSLLPPCRIEIVEPDPALCPRASLPPEGNVKHRNYRQLSDNIRAYTPTGDIHTSPKKNKLVSRYDVCADISPPRARILELVRPEDPGREALQAIVQAAPRRAPAPQATRPLDDDACRYLQRALLSPSPQGLSLGNTPEPYGHYGLSPEPAHRGEARDRRDAFSDDEDEPFPERNEIRLECPEVRVQSPDEPSSPSSGTERSLAEELREAEVGGFGGWRSPSAGWCGEECGGAEERERLGRLALAVEDEDAPDGADGLTAAARRLDALLAESRVLHAQLAGIQQDMQVLARRLAPRPAPLPAPRRRWYPASRAATLRRFPALFPQIYFLCYRDRYCFGWVTCKYYGLNHNRGRA